MADRRWTEPQGTPAPFTLLNSLTNAVGPFVPVSPGRVGWYACGPTVYDSAHMGHARAYVTFDIVRRIIEDFFGYEVFYVMNITDIEDKIILRARKNHLFAEFLKGIGSSRDKLIPVALDALRRRDEKQMKKVEVLRRKCEEVENKRQKKELQEQLSGEMSKLELYSEEHKSFLELEADKSSSFQSLVKQCQDAVSSVLDAEHGHEIDDHGIFGALSSKYEKEFLEDMNTLGVKEPDVLTRVTEYVPQIVGFISKIIEKGFAYESKGSVYFDTHKFLAAGHTYPKLKPWAGGSSELVAEGEGALSDGLEKKSDVDFALWKASRKGEPTWDSPWGPGRPGWHIECSVMASDVLGSTFDIHSGGEDLMFPHHDNEIAQSEAHFDIHQWVNYFMHAGHLSIRGLKMSKSLKNFVSIRDALEMHSPRQIRILFLLQAWDKTMIYGDQSVKEALAKEKTIKEFFLQLQVLFRKDLSGPQFWLEEDRQLHRVLSETQDSVRKHLSDNFDYPQAFNDIIELISKCNVYMKSSANIKAVLLRKIASYVHKILKIFGVIESDCLEFLNSGSGMSQTIDSAIAPFVDTFVQFREDVRSLAKKSSHKEYLTLCDDLRDHKLIQVGLRIEDLGDDTQWKLVNPEELRKEVEEKKSETDKKAIEKLKSKLDARLKNLETIQKGLLPPQVMFTSDPTSQSLYSQFDENGVPTHGADGEALSKSSKKKLINSFEKQKQAWDKTSKLLSENPRVIEDLQAEIDALKAEIAK